MSEKNFKGNRKDAQTTSENEETKNWNDGDQRPSKSSRSNKKHYNGRKTPKRNDWRFYALSDQIAKDFGSIPYNVLSGIGFLNQINSVAENGAASGATQPFRMREMSTMTINYIPTPGRSTEKTSGVNMASLQLYSYVRHANSGSKVYEAPDLMMYILGMKDIYGEYLECRRALGLVRLYDITNHYIPDMLLYAAGINSADLRSNLAQYRGRLNVIAQKINAFAVPSYFTAFARQDYISSNVFADSSSARGQFYLFRKIYYYRWSPKTSTSGTELVATPHSAEGAPVLFSARLNILEGMIDAMFLDEDANTMSGDILKAFGSDRLYSLMETPDDYVVGINFDEDILGQIENSIAFRSFTNSVAPANTEFNVKQDNTNLAILFNPTFSGATTSNAYFHFPTRFYFNSHKDEPNYTDTIEWSRLMTLPILDNSGSASQVPKLSFTFGLEMVADYTCFSYAMTGTILVQTFRNMIAQSGTTVTTDILMVTMNLEQFDWHPIRYMYILNNAGNAANVTQWAVQGDLKKFAVVGENEITPMHESCVNATFWADDLYKRASASKS